MGVINNINSDTRILVQGITGHQGTTHARLMLDYGTNIVAGVTPGKGGTTWQSDDYSLPVFNTVKEACNKISNIEWSILFVPAPFVKSAAVEALECGLNIVIITEGVPVHDALHILNVAQQNNKIAFGPNCPGFAVVDKAKLGIIPNSILQKSGGISIVSRSGTLTHEAASVLQEKGHGINKILGIGGDPIIGTTFIDAVKELVEDEETSTVILVGEIGGTMEEQVAEYISKNKLYDQKKFLAYIAGITAPKGKQMGHAGAIISGNKGTAESKIKALESANIKVAKFIYDLGKL